MWSQSVSKCAIFPSKNKAEALLSTCLIYRHFKSWLKSFFRSNKIFAWKITSCQWNYYAIFFPTLEENQIVIEMNRNSQLHNKSNQQNRPLIFFCLPQHLKNLKKDLGLPFFLTFCAHPNSWSFSNQNCLLYKKSLPKS